MCICQCHTSFTSCCRSVLTTKKNLLVEVKNLHLLSLFSNLFNPSRHYQSLPPRSTPVGPVSTLQPSFWAPAAVLWDPPKHWRSHNGTVPPLAAYEWRWHQKSIEATNTGDHFGQSCLTVRFKPEKKKQKKNIPGQKMWKWTWIKNKSVTHCPFLPKSSCLAVNLQDWCDNLKQHGQKSSSGNLFHYWNHLP